MPVNPLILTRERIAGLWDQLAPFSQLRTQLGMGTEDGFLAQLTARDTVFLEVANGSALVIAQMRPVADALVAFVAFDHDLHGKDAEFRDALVYLVRMLGLRRVSLETPATMKVLVKLAGRLGFTWEGVRRRGWAWEDVVEDVHLNGLLREELLGGDQALAA